LVTHDHHPNNDGRNQSDQPVPTLGLLSNWGLRSAPAATGRRTFAILPLGHGRS
jgi:hypothetical protein